MKTGYGYTYLQAVPGLKVSPRPRNWVGSGPSRRFVGLPVDEDWGLFTQTKADHVRYKGLRGRGVDKFKNATFPEW